MPEPTGAACVRADFDAWWTRMGRYLTGAPASSRIVAEQAYFAGCADQLLAIAERDLKRAGIELARAGTQGEEGR